MKNRWGFIFPAGSGNLEEVIAEIGAYCRKNKLPFVFSTASGKSAAALKEMYGEKAAAEPLRDLFDYVYRREDLEFLRGKKYHSKRNYINRFCEYGWTYEELNGENAAECLGMLDEWRAENECGSDPGKASEADVAQLELENFQALGFLGGLLRVDGKAAAFTFGEKRTDDCFVVHVEKAMRRFTGAYTMINREFVRRLPPQFVYINREEDTGAESLRKAKLSYHPAFMEEKFRVALADFNS